MAESDVNIHKRRKLLFDDETMSFRFESSSKTIERMGEQKTKEALAKNRGEERLLETTKRQSEYQARWYDRKTSKEMGGIRDSLKEKTAHKEILDEVARQYAHDENNNGSFGKYGPNASKTELLPRIETALKQMEPSYKRQRQAENLLDQRKKIEQMDRKLSTSAMMTRSKKKNIELPEIERRETSDDRKRATKLVLPPIVVKKSKTKMSTPSSVTREMTRMDPLPSVFVTQVVSENQR